MQGRGLAQLHAAPIRIHTYNESLIQEASSNLRSCFLSCNEFIRCFHESRILKLPIFLTNICYDFFSTGKLRQRQYLDQWEICLLFQLFKLRKIRGKKFVNQIGESIWWIRYWLSQSDEENLPLFFSRYIMHRGQPFMGPSMQIA